MTIIQRPCECSLAAICNLNRLSQEAYEALSDKVRAKHGDYSEGSCKQRKTRVAYGIRIARKAGLLVPESYIVSRMLQLPAGREIDLRGRGIATVSFFKKGCRKAGGAHAIAFDNGALLESDGKRYENWSAYVAAVQAGPKGYHRVRLDQVFRP